jgi:hypothetical protein
VLTRLCVGEHVLATTLARVDRPVDWQFAGSARGRDHPLWMMAIQVVCEKVRPMAIRTRDKRTVGNRMACVAPGIGARPRVITTRGTRLRAVSASASPDAARG